MICSSCGSDNEPDRKFCGECGNQLARLCDTCGGANAPHAKFCGECGSPLSAVGDGLIPRPEPVAERRLVSVLFVDLVGFTTVSESRDAEEVRELLSHYFETARQLVERYGGTVEKFIGDAVMAVWGAPSANEDDAERAVRAALDLVVAVSALGQEVQARDLRARAGVLTGETAVTLAAEGQGMVAGDLVNTASRIQSAAAPGTVLVGEATRRATEAAIAYEDAGSHELKGKSQAIRLWRARTVTAGRGGALKSHGLEPPFVGRERELRLVKDLYHAAADGRSAHLVSVTGLAGIGKSRLAWEFFKYIDGLADDVLWHHGRCLAYGEGVTYGALADMVRMRAQINEGDEPATARAKLRAAIESALPDGEERDWIEVRLAHLLGLEDRAAPDGQDLFAAWRLFLERLAEADPVVLVFEDMQWADASLLEFIEHLLTWSRSHSIFVVTLARPELAERHPGWNSRQRRSTSLTLEPLAPQAMHELLGGLVPGLPSELKTRILARAEGVPLYAVETVRMLLDRDLLSLSGNAYLPTRPIAALAIPETLHALVAARLDGLPAEERRLVQDAAVLGKTFTERALGALDGQPAAELHRLLERLVRKEVFSLQIDPRSPAHGQYEFLQDLLRQVAYETLARPERKARHLGAAAYLERAWHAGEQEVVEVLAAHYVEAYRTDSAAADAAAIKASARAMLARAGERAASLAGSEDAQRYFEQAAAFAGEPLLEASLLERAGAMAWAAGRAQSARDHFERAMRSFVADGQTHAAARISARLAEITWAEGHIEDAVEQMERSFAVLSTDEPDEDLAGLAAELGRLLVFTGQADAAAERIERALEIAEALGLPAVLSQALNTKGGLILAMAKGRPQEGGALLRESLRVALQGDANAAALRAYYNLSNHSCYLERHAEAFAYGRDGLALARRLGDRNWEWSLLAGIVSAHFMMGDWDDALAKARVVPHLEDFAATRFAAVELLLTLPQIHTARGDVTEARSVLDAFAIFDASADVQEHSAFHAARANVLRAEGAFADALASARKALEGRPFLGGSHSNIKLGFAEACEGAFALGDLKALEELLDTADALPVGESTPFVRAHVARFRARADLAGGRAPGAEPPFKLAADAFRESELPFGLAVTQLEHAEWLRAGGGADEADALLAESRATFERLAAKPWLERVARTAVIKSEQEMVSGTP